MGHYITLEKRLTRFRISVAGGIILWTLLLAGLLAWNINITKQETRELAKKEARATFNKDQAFRLWATKHGGVYVPATEETPPNPYLSHIPERDIQSPSGKRLTLMNPAYMLRQAMEEYDELYGIKGHITSLNLLNPMNKPDEWEQKALKAFEKGEKEVFEFTLLEDKTYLRLMQPMVVKEGCLKCHKEQGYKVGDIRGGVGVAVPMAGYFALEQKTINAIIFSRVLIWLLGMAGIGIVFAKGKKSIIEQEEAHEIIRESEEFLNSIVENIPDMIFVKDAKELRFVKFNKAGEELLGYQRKDLYGKNDHDFFPHEEAEFFTGKDREVLNSKQLLDIPEETIKTHYKGNRILHTKKIPIADAEGNPKFLLGISEDITERKNAEEHILKLNRVYRVLSRINEAIVRIRDTRAMFNETCRIAVEEGGFIMAWIGILDDMTMKVEPVAHFGKSEGYIEKLNITLSDDPHGHGPTASALRTGEHSVCNDIEHDPHMAPWREAAMRLGYKSSIALPLILNGRTRGTFNLYAGESYLFDKEEVMLLDELAMDISFSMEFAEKEADRKKAEEAAAASQKLMQDITDNSSALIYAFDTQGKCLMVNQRFEALFNVPHGNLIGKLRETIMPPEIAEEHRVNDIKVMKSLKPIMIEEANDEHDGQHIYLSVKFPLIDPQGNLYGVGGISTDITKRKLDEKERENLHKELEQILYAASHDLKTPLVNINGYSGELKYSIDKLLRNMEKEAVSSEAREEISSLIKELPESFNFISSSVSRMDSLLNGLLEFSRSGRVELKKEAIDMDMLIKMISDSINYKLKEKGASLEIAGLPACRGDRNNLSRVFSNLIENAVKYLDPARKGKITVTGYKEDNQSVYCVEDNGIGIASEHQKQIFHIFHKLDPDMTGEGLGLAIVQRIVERHSGKIWLESEKGKGSRFYVALPSKA